MTNPTIRQVTLADLDACHTIEAACYTTDAAPKENIRKRIETFPQGFLVAEFDGQLIGFINSGATNKDDISAEAFKAMAGHDDEGRNIVIFSVAITPAFQGRGFSRPLMHEFIERARQLNKARILLICKSELIPYYQSFGFSYGAPSASTHGGFAWHEMVLVL